MAVPKVLLFTAIFLFVLYPSYGGAVSQPSVVFIPDRFTTNSSFIAIADVADKGSVRISWIIPGTGSYGQFPNIDGRFVCYFSSEDAESTCGPYPLIPGLTGNLTFTAIATDSSGKQSQNDVSVDVGGIEIDPLIQVNGNSVSIVIFPGSAVSSAKYAVYGKKADLLNGYKAMSCLIVGDTGYQCIANTTLEDGEYFIAMSVESGSGAGGSVERIVVGQTQAGDDQESKIKTDTVNFAALIESNQVYQVSNFLIVNLGNETIPSLSVSIPPGLGNVLGIQLQNTTLQPFGSVLFKVTLSNINAPTGIFTIANVLSGQEKIGEIPVNITVSVKQVSAPTGSSTLPVTPDSFTGNFLVSDGSQSEQFSVTNSGSQAITFGTPAYTGNLAGIASVTPPQVIQAGASGTFSVTLNPAQAGLYQGIISIPTQSGLVQVLVSADFFTDIKGQISGLRDDFESFRDSLAEQQLELFGQALDDVESSIGDAESSIGFGNYEVADEDYRKALAKFDLLQSLASSSAPPQQGFEFNIMYIAVAGIVIIALLAFVAVKKRKGRKKGKGKAGEEEFGEDEEFGEEESGEDEEF